MFGRVSVFCVCRSDSGSLLYIVVTVVVMSGQCCFPYTQAYLYYFNCDNFSLVLGNIHGLCVMSFVLSFCKRINHSRVRELITETTYAQN